MQWNFARQIFLSCFVALLVACGSASKRVYPYLDLMDAKITPKTTWVARAGDIGETQFKQLPTVISGDYIYVATYRGDLARLSAATGKLEWHTHLDDYITAGPTIVENTAYLVTESAEAIAVEMPSGKILWRTPLSSEVLVAPVPAENKLIIQTADERIFALNRSNGNTLWVESREIPALTLRGTSTPVVVGDTIYTGFGNGTVAALNLSNGKTRWETSIAVARGRSDLERVVDVDGLIYHGTGVLYAAAFQGRIAAISMDNGQVLWMRDMSSYNGVISDGQQLYVTDAESKLWALDVKTGATLWRQDKLSGRDISNPAILGKTLVVGDGDGFIHWMSTSDGEMLAQQSLNKIYSDAFLFWGDDDTEGRQATVTVEPVVHDQYVYIRDNAGALSVFSLDTNS